MTGGWRAWTRLHVVLRLPTTSTTSTCVTAASWGWREQLNASVRGGLVLCYAGLPETQADAAARRLAETLTAGSAAPHDERERR